MRHSPSFFRIDSLLFAFNANRNRVGESSHALANRPPMNDPDQDFRDRKLRNDRTWCPAYGVIPARGRTDDPPGWLAQHDPIPRDVDHYPRSDRVADSSHGAINDDESPVLIDENGIDSRQRLLERDGRRRRPLSGGGSCIG